MRGSSVSTPTVEAPAAVTGARSAGRSNSDAVAALGEKQARTFEPLVPSSVQEFQVDFPRLGAHAASLWGQIVGGSAARSSFAPETPVVSFESSGLRDQLQAAAVDGTLVRDGTWTSDWTGVGGFGLPGADSLVSTPLAQGRLELTALVGDLQVIRSGEGEMSTRTDVQRTLGASAGAEAGASAGPATAKVSGSQSSAVTAGAGASRSMEVPMTFAEGLLAFDCKVTIKRAFGPAETRIGRVVAGRVTLLTGMSLGS